MEDKGDQRFKTNAMAVRHVTAPLTRLLELFQLPSNGILVVVGHLISFLERVIVVIGHLFSFLEHIALAARTMMTLRLEGFGILMDNSTLFFSEPDGTLLTAIAPELFHILVGVAIAFGVPATAPFSDGPWMAVIIDLIQDFESMGSGCSGHPC